MKVLVPDGWVKATLSEAAVWSSGGTPTRTNPSYFSGSIPWIKTGELGPKFLYDSEEKISEDAVAASSAKVFPAGSVALAMYGATIGKASILAVDASTNQACAVGKPDAVSSLFLYYFLLSQREYFVDAGKGGAQPNISQGIVKSWPMLIPPRNEQARIVEKLEELLSDLDAGVAELKVAQRKVAQYRISLLKAAVEGALTADWREVRAARVEPQENGADLLKRILSERRARWEQKQLARFAAHDKAPPKGWQARYPEPVAPKAVGLPALPKGWVWASVDQCAVDEDGVTDGPFGSNLKSSHYTEVGPRVVRLQNIGDGQFVNAQAHISQEHYESLRKHAVIEGDVVVAMLGEVLPRACVVPPGVAPAIVKADCARIRISADLLTPDLMSAVLNSEPTRRRVADLVKGIGRPRVNLGSLRGIPVPIAPTVEQVEVQASLARAIEACEQQNAALDRGFALAAAQRRSLLKAAFAGQIVPQDPCDEPASVLLAHIRDARSLECTTVGNKRGRKAKKGA